MNKLKHKLLSVFIAIAMVVSLVPLGGIKVSAMSPNPWGYTTAYAGGAGTSGDPYQINTAAQLAFLAQQVNGGNSYVNYSFVLTSDIDLSAHDWTPIGDTKWFLGHFDGAGHKVTGLKIGTNDEPSTITSYVGLFGYLGYDDGCIGSIKNLGVDASIWLNSDTEKVGGLVGCNDGDITNCYVTGSLTNSFALPSYSHPQIGGLVGYSDGNITNCNSVANVTVGKCQRVGGLVGFNQGSILNSYTTGNVTGGSGMVAGFAGSSTGTITNCYSTGNVTGGASATVAGFGTGYGTITNCYCIGVVGSSAGLTSMTASAMASATFATTLNTNRTDTTTQKVWKHVSGKNQGFPVLLNVGDGIPFAAPLLTTSVALGTAVGTTKATATPDAGNTLAVFVSTVTIVTPNVGDSLPIGSAAYTSGSDISGVSTGKFLEVYEVDSSNTIVKFKLITLASGDIKAADAPVTPPVIPAVTPPVTPATKVDITPQVVQSTGSAVVTVNKADIKKDATNVITPTVTSDTTAVETRVDVSAIAGGTGNLELKSGSSDVVLPIGAVDLTGTGEGSYLAIKQVVSKDDTLVKTITGVSKAFEFTAATYDKNGNKIKDIHEFLANNKVKITIQLTAADIKGLDTAKFAAFYYNETTKLYENLGGTYDSATMTFTFETTHFSKYVLGQANTTGAILPKTGSLIDMNLVLVVGLLMMVLGASLVLRKRPISK